MAAVTYDAVIETIADYVYDFEVKSPKAWRQARIALLDSVACAIESIPACSFIGPVDKTAVLPHGFPLPGTSLRVDPVKAAFDLGSLIRYLDHNDAFPGAEWGHPSDNIGAILPVADWLSRKDPSVTMKSALECIIKAYEIQGCFQIKNAFNKVGLDHVILVKVAATAVLSKLVGLSKSQGKDAITQAFADGHPLRVYRQAPNTTPRKGWAAGDACSRAVQLVFMTKSGQPGFPTVLTTPKWGFYDVYFGGKQFNLPVPFGSMVEDRLIKLVVAEGHAISAVEAALILSKQLQDRVGSIRSIHIRTTEAAMIITDKTGPLTNAADRDHCMQYIVAVTLLKGDWLEIEDYEDHSRWVQDPRVDDLRKKISMEEDPQMTTDYHNPELRRVASGLTVTLEDGTVLDEVVIHLPLGHPYREDNIPRAKEKFCALTKTAVADPAGVWDRTLLDTTLGTRVCDWVDQFAQ